MKCDKNHARTEIAKNFKYLALLENQSWHFRCFSSFKTCKNLTKPNSSLIKFFKQMQYFNYTEKTPCLIEKAIFMFASTKVILVNLFSLYK